MYLVEYKTLDHGKDQARPYPATTGTYTQCFRSIPSSCDKYTGKFYIDIGVVIGGDFNTLSDRQDAHYYFEDETLVETNASVLSSASNSGSFVDTSAMYDRNVIVTNSFITSDSATYPVGRVDYGWSGMKDLHFPETPYMQTPDTLTSTYSFENMYDYQYYPLYDPPLPVFNRRATVTWMANGGQKTITAPCALSGASQGYAYDKVALTPTEAPPDYDFTTYNYWRLRYKVAATGSQTLSYIRLNSTTTTRYFVVNKRFFYQHGTVRDVSEIADVGNVRLSFSWNNLPTVVMSPISSIVLTLDGINLNCEIQPVNINLPAGSSLTQSIPVVENYYSLATTLRDLHDELVITRPDFDGNTKYTLDKQAGRERTVKISAKYLTKDGKLYQLFIPKNGVFSVQFTFRITYSIY